MEAGDRRTRLRAQRPRSLDRDFSSLVELVRVAGEEPTTGWPRASAARSRTSPPCGACRCRSPACCRPARRRRSRPPSSRTSAPISSRRCPTRCASWRRHRRHAPDSNDDRFEQALRYTTLIAPKLTIQGGTREIPARHHRPRPRPAVMRRFPPSPRCEEMVEDEGYPHKRAPSPGDRPWSRPALRKRSECTSF